MAFRILITKDESLPVNLEKIKECLNSLCVQVKVHTLSTKVNLDEGVVVFPDTHKSLKQLLNPIKSSFDFAIHFTRYPYYDNYFYHCFDNKYQIVSMYGWDFLTNLPYENGVVGFIGDSLRDKIDGDFRHFENTGCLFDFLADKKGIDDCLRNVAICPECLDRINSLKLNKNQKALFNDLKNICNAVSSSSKWNQSFIDYLSKSKKKVLVKKKADIVAKRVRKQKGIINILLASPGDTIIERQTLLDKLERKFREDGFEKNCGRIIVNGWESLASQNGYPQDVINHNLVSNADIILAVFKHKIGTPTINTRTKKKRAESGTIEELYSSIDNQNPEKSPLGMAYFYSAPPVMSFEVHGLDGYFKEWKRLKEFQKNLNSKIIYKMYNNSDELLNITCVDIQKNIQDYFED